MDTNFYSRYRLLFTFLFFIICVFTYANYFEKPLYSDKKVNPNNDLLLKYNCSDCNLLVISIDTLNKKYLPCYGYPKNTAPNICGLAKSGYLFENFIGHGYLTNTSMMSILTSKYPSESGMTDFFSNIKDTDKTLAEVLTSNGYRGIGYGSAPELTSKKLYDFFDEKNQGNYPTFKKGLDSLDYSGSRDLPFKAIDILRENAKSKFFLWFSIGTVHFPYAFYGGNYFESEFYNPDYNGPLKQFDYIDYNSLLSRIYNNKYYPIDKGQPIELTSQDTEYIKSKYDYGIKYTDDFIGNILGELKKQGILDKTLVVIHGVHGEEMGDNGYYGHYDIVEGEIGTALIIYNPKDPNQKKIKDVVRGIDVFPTLIDILNLKKDLPNDLEGRSIVPMLEGQPIEELPTYIERVPLWEDLRRPSTNEPSYIKNKAIDFMKKNSFTKAGDVGIRYKDQLLIHRRSRDFENAVSIWNWLSPDLIKRDEYELYSIQGGKNIRLDVNKNNSDFSDLKNKVLQYEKRFGIQYGFNNY